MIALDQRAAAEAELEEEKRRDKIIKDCGAIPIGERGGLVWFTDSVTKTTLVLEPHQVTAAHVRAKLLASRRKFGVPTDGTHS